MNLWEGEGFLIDECKVFAHGMKGKCGVPSCLYASVSFCGN